MVRMHSDRLETSWRSLTSVVASIRNSDSVWPSCVCTRPSSGEHEPAQPAALWVIGRALADLHHASAVIALASRLPLPLRGLRVALLSAPELCCRGRLRSAPASAKTLPRSRLPILPHLCTREGGAPREWHCLQLAHLGLGGHGRAPRVAAGANALASGGHSHALEGAALSHRHHLGAALAARGHGHLRCASSMSATPYREATRAARENSWREAAAAQEPR